MFTGFLALALGQVTMDKVYTPAIQGTKRNKTYRQVKLSSGESKAKFKKLLFEGPTTTTTTTASVMVRQTNFV